MQGCRVLDMRLFPGQSLLCPGKTEKVSGNKHLQHLGYLGGIKYFPAKPHLPPQQYVLQMGRTIVPNVCP